MYICMFSELELANGILGQIVWVSGIIGKHRASR